MKKKDIFTLIVCVVFISGSLYFLIKMFYPSNKSANNTSNDKVTQQEKYNWTIDTDTLKKVTERKDYGGTTLDNIGRQNPFGQLN